MTYHADREKETQNVVRKLLFSAQMQPIYASCFCSPGCYFMPPHKPKTIQHWSGPVIFLLDNNNVL